MATTIKLPNGHRYVKQNGYKRGQFHNWAIFDREGNLLQLGGRTKKQSREYYIRTEEFRRLCNT